MLEFTFLGCCGSVQDAAASNTSLLLRSQSSRVVVDLSGSLDLAVQADPDAVILTHEHIDHVYGLPSLLHQLWLCGRQRPLELHFPKGMEPLVQGMLELFGLEQKPHMFAIRRSTWPVFEVGDLQFCLYRTDHTGVSVGLVVQQGSSKLVYPGDTRPLAQPLPEMLGADVLIHEASGPVCQRDELIRKGHSTGADAGRLARQLQVQELYLCHLPPEQAQQQLILQQARAEFAQACIPQPRQPLCLPGKKSTL